MYEKFTDRARLVLQLANEEAQRQKSMYIGTEHFLLGLIMEEQGIACKVLRSFGIDLEEVSARVEKLIQVSSDEELPDKLPQAPKIKRVVDSAIREALSLGHDYIGTEHLLLGVLQEEESVAVQIILNFGCKLNDVREGVLSLLEA